MNVYYVKFWYKTIEDMFLLYLDLQAEIMMNMMSFFKSFENSTPLFIVILDDFNARSMSLWVNGKTILEGTRLKHSQLFMALNLYQSLLTYYLI